MYHYFVNFQGKDWGDQPLVGHAIRVVNSEETAMGNFGVIKL